MAVETCPVCGSTEWTADYDRMADGDEMRVDRCDRCGWPPAAPYAVEEWRERQERAGRLLRRAR